MSKNTFKNSKELKALKMSKIEEELEKFNKNCKTNYTKDDIIFLFNYDDEAPEETCVGIGDDKSSLDYYYFLSDEPVEDVVKHFEEQNVFWVVDCLEDLLKYNAVGRDEDEDEDEYSYYEKVLEPKFFNDKYEDQFSEEEFDNMTQFILEDVKLYVYRIFAVVM